MALTVSKTDVGAKPAGRQPNAAYRSREHLTENEVVRLVKAARRNRRGARDAALIFVMYRHGLRVSEVCALDWSAVDFTAHEVYVRRAKHGKPATHPIRGDELRALRRVHRDTGWRRKFTSAHHR